MRSMTSGILYVRFISPEYFSDGSVRRAQRVLDLFEHVAYPFDHGDEVHADVIIGGVCYSAVGCEAGRCVLKGRCGAGVLDGSLGSEIVRVEVTDVERVRGYLERVARERISYCVPVWDFAVPGGVLGWLDEDVDCERPETWGRLFCSQFVLLVLRYCHKEGLLDGGSASRSRSSGCRARGLWGLLDGGSASRSRSSGRRARGLWGCNSKVCTPAHLRVIVRAAIGV